MSSVKKNYLYNVIYEILIIVLPLITSPYISRVLGAENVGVYTYHYSIVSYFVLFARLGIINYGSRSIAGAKTEHERNKVFTNGLIIQFFLAGIMTILYLLYITFLGKENPVISIIMILYLIAAAFDINWLFFGLEKFKITVTRNIVIKVISTVFLFSVVKTGEDLWKYVLVLGGSQFVGQIAVWPYLRNTVKLVKPQIKFILADFKEIFILFIPQIAVSLYKTMDKIMVGNLCPKTELGYYEYAALVINLPLGFITSLGTVMLPRISSLMKNNDKEKSLEYTKYSMMFAMGLSTAFAFGLAGVAPTFVPLYFGEEFAPTAQLMMGLASTLLFLAWANVVRTQYLIPNKKDKEYIISLFVGAFINLAINIALIPKLQAWGAVIGTIAAEVAVCLVQTFMSRKYIPVWQYLKFTLSFVVVGLGMFAIVRTVSLMPVNDIISLGLQIIAGAAFYLGFVAILLLKVFKIPFNIKTLISRLKK